MEKLNASEDIPHPISLRQAKSDDLNFLFGVSTEAMRPVVETLNPDKAFDEQEERSKYEEKFKPENIEVIQYDGQDVGRLRVVKSEDSIYIGGIQILPEFQDKGIGTSILTDLVEESEKTGLPIVLEVHDVNEKAIGFYKKLGFVEGEKVKDQTVMRYVPKSTMV